MSCLQITTKIAMMLDSMQTAKRMLKADDIRPDTKLRLEEDIATLKNEVKGLYIDLFKIIRN